MPIKFNHQLRKGNYENPKWNGKECSPDDPAKWHRKITSMITKKKFMLSIHIFIYKYSTGKAGPT
jgi:hypothetical protein